MNEVAKLYKNAGVSCKPSYVYNKVPILSGLKYPPFTAEKQLELIKWLLEKYCDIRITHNLEDFYYITSFGDVSCLAEDFGNALASFFNNLWQDLTDTDKVQIKEILE